MTRTILLTAFLVVAVAAPARGADPVDPSRQPAVAVDAGDAPEVEEALEAQSAEIDEVRLAEEKAALVPLPHPEDGAAREAVRLGTESPLRYRIDGALSRDTAPMPEEDAGSIALLPEIGHDLRRLQAEYDIPIDVNEAVVQYVRFFQAPVVRKHFVKWLGRLPRYQERYRTILREAGLPEDTIFLAMIESGFANLAYSRAKAAGPWQFIPSTGKRMGLSQDFWVDERRDPEKSARAAATYLKALHAEFGDWRLAWAGYNAGEGKIEKAKRKGQLDFWEMARGKVLKRETKGYVPKLMAAAIIAKHPEAFGFRAEEIEAERWTEYERVTIPHAVELEAVARAAEVTSRDLHELNPELRRSCTPPARLPGQAARGRRRGLREELAVDGLERGARVRAPHRGEGRGRGRHRGRLRCPVRDHRPDERPEGRPSREAGNRARHPAHRDGPPFGRPRHRGAGEGPHRGAPEEESEARRDRAGPPGRRAPPPGDPQRFRASPPCRSRQATPSG